MRAAATADADTIVEISTGPIAGKRTFIEESLTRRTSIAACIAERIVGYIVWDRSFFGRPFVWLLGVDPAFRRRGIAARLMHAFEAACSGEARFVSTNQSNRAMQALLVQLGFTPSGSVYNLDPDDPELFFFKPAARS